MTPAEIAASIRKAQKERRGDQDGSGLSVTTFSTDVEPEEIVAALQEADAKAQKEEYDRALARCQRITAGMNYKTVCTILGSEGDRSMAMGNRELYTWTIDPGISIRATFIDEKLKTWDIR